MSYGITQHQSKDGNRWEIECPHQSGALYIVPAEGSWVCSEELRTTHALAGFFQELTHLNQPQVRELMQRWGLYFRERPISAEASEISATKKLE